LKKINYILFLLLICNIAYCQKPKLENLPKYDIQKLHFGFTIGFNNMDFVVKPIKDMKTLDSVYIVEAIPVKGFDLGIIANLRLREHWDLRFVPNLAFGQRNMEYSIKEQDTVLSKYVKSIESTYINFPITFKYKSARVNNFRAYLLAGGRFSIDLMSQADKKDQEEEFVKIKKQNVALDAGVGFDFYLYYFKFSIELKMSYGLNDMLKRDNTIFTQSVDKLSSKIFYLSFNFE